MADLEFAVADADDELLLGQAADLLTTVNMSAGKSGRLARCLFN